MADDNLKQRGIAEQKEKWDSILKESYGLDAQPPKEDHIHYINDCVREELDFGTLRFDGDPRDLEQKIPRKDHYKLMTVFSDETVDRIVGLLRVEHYQDLLANIRQARHHLRYDNLWKECSKIKEFLPKLSVMLMGKALETEFFMDYVKKSANAHIITGNIDAYQALAMDPIIATYDYYAMDAFQIILYAYRLKTVDTNIHARLN